MKLRKTLKNMGNVVAKFVKKSIFSKIKLAGLLMKKRASFPTKTCPVFKDLNANFQAILWNADTALCANQIRSTTVFMCSFHLVMRSLHLLMPFFHLVMRSFHLVMRSFHLVVRSLHSVMRSFHWVRCSFHSVM